MMLNGKLDSKKNSRVSFKFQMFKFTLRVPNRKKMFIRLIRSVDYFDIYLLIPFYIRYLKSLS